MKQTLQQRMRLKINPLQIQYIKLLEIPTHQLEQRFQEEIEQNPLLEAEEHVLEHDDSPAEDFSEQPETEEGQEEQEEQEESEFSLDRFNDDMGDDDDVPDYRLNISNASRDDNNQLYTPSNPVSFRENLVWQLGLRSLSEKEVAICEYIIGDLDGNGYLSRAIENITDDLAFKENMDVSDAEVARMLTVVQELDPAGVGARNLRECLLLQINRLIQNETTPSESLLNARSILTGFFEEFSNKHYEKILGKMKIDEITLRDAISEILRLTPKPGGSSSDTHQNEAEKIIPDFILELVNGEPRISLNNYSVPEIRINKEYYATLLEQIKNSTNEKSKSDAATWVRHKLGTAKSFIDAVQQRNNTLLLTMEAILELQHDYFATGDESQLKPMILSDVAQLTGLDVSTISRVSNAKYIQTWFGIFPLKAFFNGSMQNTEGEDISTSQIKKGLRELVDGEDKHNPLTDDQLVEMMEKKGFKIARRTIAKYRQLLDIPVARLRRDV